MAVTCSGGLILHLDGTTAGCTNDEDGDCPALDVRHMGQPKRCLDLWGECDYCGVH
jgi:hypothetical protein